MIIKAVEVAIIIFAEITANIKQKPFKSG